jgi:lysine 6-dehydrogenase
MALLRSAGPDPQSGIVQARGGRRVKRVLVLGGGMVGSVLARDLAADGASQVTVADRRPEVLAALSAAGLAAVEVDLSDAQRLRSVAGAYDVVVGALPGALGFGALGAMIEAGRPYVDISFMPEDALSLDESAREAGVSCVVDCGVAPGIASMLVGRAAGLLEPCERIDIYVGGLPREPTWPYGYRAGFSPHDVIEEYVRPARMKVGGRVVVKEALSEPELIEIPGVGTLEAFNTDGLRSLLTTIDVPEMREKTLRYPGHRELMSVLRWSGFFGTQPVAVNGTSVRPLDVTAALLFPRWTFAPGEADVTVLRVSAVGQRKGRRRRLLWDLVDCHDALTDTRSMARTTAFPAAVVTRLILAGHLDQPGVHPPEWIARRPQLLDHMLAELGRRGVRFRSSTEDLP